MPQPCSQSLQTPTPVDVESSAIAQVAYDSQWESLHVLFRDGEIYRYEGVPTRLYQALLQADSKGSYFNSYIRSQFRYHIVQRGRLELG